jgi:hypothetical protein
MNRVFTVHPEDFDCVVEPGVTRKQLNDFLLDQGLFFQSIRVPMRRSAAWLRPVPPAQLPSVMER